MFLLNSRLGLFSAASCEAPLIPKLRGHFAEFLNKGSPARLRILSSPTCVGLRYGHLHTPQQLFSPAWIQQLRYLFSLPITAQNCNAYFTTLLPYCLDGLYHSAALPILLCHCLSQTCVGGTGISTCCPSPTTSVLGLGPDLP